MFSIGILNIRLRFFVFDFIFFISGNVIIGDEGVDVFILYIFVIIVNKLMVFMKICIILFFFNGRKSYYFL